jgi:hypothetical protein
MSGNELATSFTASKDQGLSQSLVLSPENAQTAIAPGQILKDFRRGVLRAVIDHNQFKFDTMLANDALQR